MPEGPSLVILKEEVQRFTGKKILAISGNTTLDLSFLVNQKVMAFKTWGKHFLICFPQVTLRIHFLLFGSYSILEQTKANPRLALQFANGTLYFYSCSVLVLTEDPNDIYDWSADIMNDAWDPVAARRKLKAKPGMLVCDAALDQTIFSGAGNIFKNEVLFRIKVHPESMVGKLPPRKLTEFIKQMQVYAFEFLEWKKAFVLKQHWLAHTKSVCPRCNIPFVKKHLGKTHRRSFYCENCQALYR